MIEEKIWLQLKLKSNNCFLKISIKLYYLEGNIYSGIGLIFANNNSINALDVAR